MMNLAIIGYGKMGKAIEKLALEKGHNISLILDKEEDWDRYSEDLSKADVAIEFTMPDTAIKNIKRCIALGIPIITGTTGWHKELDSVRELCNEHNATVFYASNFSVGVNILFKLNAELAKIMEAFPEYKVDLKEEHHIHKLDAPSGTAISIIDQIIDNNKYIERWTDEQEAKENEIAVEAVREGEIIGNHSVCWESEIDSVRIEHKAKNRNGFALGAIMAAEWIEGKKGLFSMQDMLFKKNY